MGGDARLSGRLGLGSRRVRWRPVASLGEGPMVAYERLVRVASRISACPLTPWILKRSTGIAVSGRVQFAFAAPFFIAGKIALREGI